tara:strand:+ start:2984 stop:3754 length:771 start_codon:yes stop_codon:yes gene_type:complete
MTNKSIKKLKVTVTNIKSVLVRDSKRLSKFKSKGERIEYNKLQLSKRENKESNLEKMKRSSPMSGVSKRIGSAFSSPIKKFEQVVGLILGGIFINALPPLVSKVKNAFDGVRKRFDQLNSVIKKILGFINAITEPIKQLFGFVGASNNINPNDDTDTDNLEFEDQEIEIEGRADGGEVEEGTPYIVGERGKELFVPDQSGTIIPNDELNPDSVRSTVIKPSPNKLSNLDAIVSKINRKRVKSKDKLIIIQKEYVDA